MRGVRVHIHVCNHKTMLCVTLMNHLHCVKLTHGAQSNVTEDDDDEDDTANHVSAAPEREDSLMVRRAYV